MTEPQPIEYNAADNSRRCWADAIRTIRLKKIAAGEIPHNPECTTECAALDSDGSVKSILGLMIGEQK